MSLIRTVLEQSVCVSTLTRLRLPNIFLEISCSFNLATDFVAPSAVASPVGERIPGESSALLLLEYNLSVTAATISARFTLCMGVWFLRIEDDSCSNEFFLLDDGLSPRPVEICSSFELLELLSLLLFRLTFSKLGFLAKLLALHPFDWLAAPPHTSILTPLSESLLPLRSSRSLLARLPAPLEFFLLRSSTSRMSFNFFATRSGIVEEAGRSGFSKLV